MLSPVPKPSIPHPTVPMNKYSSDSIKISFTIRHISLWAQIREKFFFLIRNKSDPFLLLRSVFPMSTEISGLVKKRRYLPKPPLQSFEL